MGYVKGSRADYLQIFIYVYVYVIFWKVWLGSRQEGLIYLVLAAGFWVKEGVFRGETGSFLKTVNHIQLEEFSWSTG